MPPGNTDIIDSDALTAFCQAIAKADESDAILRQKESPSFNVFRALRAEFKELSHSNWLAYLFDPVREHGQGTRFLEAFLDKCVLSSGEGTILKKINQQKAFQKSQWIVSTEVPFNDMGTTGRIDLVLRSFDLDCVIAIENKLLADDQPNQLKRYSDNWLAYQREREEHRFLLYLTLDGHKAKGPLGKYPPLNVTYGGQVKSALEHCLTSCQKNPNLLPALQQYNDMITKIEQPDSPAVIGVLKDVKHASCLLPFYKNERAAFRQAREWLIQQFRSKLRNLDPTLIQEGGNGEYDCDADSLEFFTVESTDGNFRVVLGDYFFTWIKEHPIGWGGRYGLFIAFGVKTADASLRKQDLKSGKVALGAELVQLGFNFKDNRYLCACHLPTTTNGSSAYSFADYYFNCAQPTGSKDGWLDQSAEQARTILHAPDGLSLMDRVRKWAQTAKTGGQSIESPPQ